MDNIIFTDTKPWSCPGESNEWSITSKNKDMDTTEGLDLTDVNTIRPDTATPRKKSTHKSFCHGCQLHQLRPPCDVVWGAVRDGDDEAPPPSSACLPLLAS